MQKLESTTCQEADYAFCKLKKKTSQIKLDEKYSTNVSKVESTNLLIGGGVGGGGGSSGSTIENSKNIILNNNNKNSSSNVNKNSTITGESQAEKRGATDQKIGGGSPPKKTKTNTSSNHPNCFLCKRNDSKHYNIHDKLRELYCELKVVNIPEAKKLHLRNTSFLLEKLVVKDNLNTLVLNLYPGNKGYSLAFRTNKSTTELINTQEANTSTNSRNPSRSGAPSTSSSSTTTTTNNYISDNENLEETMRWPYEEEDLLECINNEELPLVLVDIFEKKCPNLFYSGCVIIEVRDYRQSFPIYTCDTYHVLLKPTNQTLLADVNLITSEGEWTNQEKLALESQLILATAEPLCLEPNPAVGIISVNQQHRRYLLNTPTIRRQAKKFSQVAINRKRKTVNLRI